MSEQNIQHIANNGSVQISTANSNLNGQGTLGTVLTAGNSQDAAGTVISTITVKATSNTSLGMVRLFIGDGSNQYLFREIMIPANDQTGVQEAFSTTVTDPIVLQPGYLLYASTENAETFNIIASGQDIINCGC